MYNRIVLLLLIFINILNTILDRDGNSGDRSIIYVFNGAVMLVMAYECFVSKIRLPKYFSWVKRFLCMIIVYLLLQYTIIHNEYFVLGQYIRMLMSMLMFIYFYVSEQSKKDIKYIRIFVLTYILQCSAKIITGHWFVESGDLEGLTGGDTASMGLAMVIPLIFLYFEGKQSFSLFLICCLFSCLSLRRTSLLALAVAVPFIWQSIKGHFNRRNIIYILIALIGISIMAWKYVGAQLIIRFAELANGIEDSSGSVSYGSGRTDYWLQAWNGYIRQGNYFFGNGMGSVYEMYSIENAYVKLPHAHSDFFELLYTFGIVGCFCWCYYIWNIFKRAKQYKPSYYKQLLYGSIAIYTFVALASGILLRTEFFPCVMSMSILTRKLDNKYYN